MDWKCWILVDYTELYTELNAQWHHDFPLIGTQDLSAGVDCSGANTKTFTISYDGGVAATITLDQNYNITALLLALQTKIDVGIGAGIVTISLNTLKYVQFELIRTHYITLVAGVADFLVIMGITAGTYHANIPKPTLLDGAKIKEPKYPDIEIVISVNAETFLGKQSTNNSLQQRSQYFFITIDASTRANMEILIGECRRILLNKSISGGFWKVTRIPKYKELPTRLRAELLCEEILMIANSGWN
jgi:hypothetical protein